MNNECHLDKSLGLTKNKWGNYLATKPSMYKTIIMFSGCEWATSVNTCARKQVKSSLVQTELSKPSRQVEALPLR